MKTEINKHMPLISRLVVLFWFICLLPIALIIFSELMSWPTLIIPIAIIGLLWLSLFIFFVIELINALGKIIIIINHDGMSYKKDDIHKWGDVQSISLVQKFYMRYGYGYVRIIIKYKDNYIIKFEPAENIKKIFLNAAKMNHSWRKLMRFLKK